MQLQLYCQKFNKHHKKNSIDVSLNILDKLPWYKSLNRYIL